jgi:ribosomal protein L44E
VYSRRQNTKPPTSAGKEETSVVVHNLVLTLQCTSCHSSKRLKNEIRRRENLTLNNVDILTYKALIIRFRLLAFE